MKRRVLLCAAASAVAVVPLAAHGQAYPAKPIRMITQFAAGSGGDKT